MIKSFFGEFLSVRRELNIALGLCLILVGLIEFWWYDLPPLFGWSKAPRVAGITVNLCLAYVASWIFFFVRDHWERRQDEAKLKNRIDIGLWGLFSTFTDFGNSVYEQVEGSTPQPWEFIIGDDLILFDDWEAVVYKKDDFIGRFVAQRVVEDAYFRQKEHYYGLKVISQNLPSGVLLELENINNAYSALLIAFNSMEQRKGNQSHQRIGYMAVTIHLHMFHLKGRLRGKYVPNDQELRALLDAGRDAWFPPDIVHPK